MSIDAAPADPVADPGIRAVHAGAAHLAQRPVRRPDLARRKRDAAVERARRPQLLPGVDRAAPAEADDGAPWHDPAMPLPDRMKLAEGKPLPRRMMAAMAQQDCSQCGYNCKDYADALFTKKEARLNLCVPGGKDTARMLKNLYAELGAPQPAGAGADVAPAPAAPYRRPAARATIRPSPRSSRAAASTRKARKRKPGISNSILPTCGLDYEVGD